MPLQIVEKVNGNRVKNQDTRWIKKFQDLFTPLKLGRFNILCHEHRAYKEEQNKSERGSCKGDEKIDNLMRIDWNKLTQLNEEKKVYILIEFNLGICVVGKKNKATIFFRMIIYI